MIILNRDRTNLYSFFISKLLFFIYIIKNFSYATLPSQIRVSTLSEEALMDYIYFV